MLEKFINATIKPLLIIGGIGTALAGVNAFFPQFSVENVQKLQWVQEYTLFVQHWGMMVCMMGVMMVAAAYIKSWRVPIMLYSMIEKAFMVFLAVSNYAQPYAEGFFVPATMDTIITAYSILYFISLKRKTD